MDQQVTHRIKHMPHDFGLLLALSIALGLTSTVSWQTPSTARNQLAPCLGKHTLQMGRLRGVSAAAAATAPFLDPLLLRLRTS